MKEGTTNQSLFSNRPHREQWVELGIWVVILAVLLNIHLFPRPVADVRTSYLIAGGVLAYSLAYYFICWRFLRVHEDQFAKDLVDIIYIGLIVLVAKEYSVFLLTLLFLPIAAAAFALDLLHSLLIATITTVLMTAEILLIQFNYFDQTTLYLTGSQLAIFILVTLFTRFLALQVRQERRHKDTAKAHLARLQFNQEPGRIVQMHFEEQRHLKVELTERTKIIAHNTNLLLKTPSKLTKTQLGYVETIDKTNLALTKVIDGIRTH